MTARARAEAAQRAASDPAVSAFVAASAGSGKTKLLTDRLLRLLLGGADPARILCLTFTRAAAAEMALRLQQRLGRWVGLPDAGLDEELRVLDIAPDAPLRARARALFARVLDLPGGMRIGTIHAFCQSLLRRFPLEAELSPHFALEPEPDALLALREAREAALARADDAGGQAAVATLAGLVSEEEFGRLVQALDAARERLVLDGDALAAAQRRALGAPVEDPATLRVVTWPGEAALRRCLETIARRASPAVQVVASTALDWLALPAPERAAGWQRWCDGFFTAAGKPRARSKLINAKLDSADPDLWPVLEAEQARLSAIDEAIAAQRAAEVSAAALRLAAPALASRAAEKQRAGLLDYADLIGRTQALLREPGAAWVLFKLDGGLDHLLLDEVQDTAPAQWQIAGALSAEFFAGEGAREARRTVFAVGDRKQSIYSFQGADLASFDHWRAELARRVRAAGEVWHDGALDVSFRSTAPVLALADAVFANADAAAGVADPARPLRHQADRAGQAGRVEQWPLVPHVEVPAAPDWEVPDANQGLTSAPQRLAEALAGWIAGQTDGTVALESRGRPLAPGDVLVLVRRRNAFATALVRALKARGVPVAGLDRLVLTGQPAVQDLMALADALLLPEDDLAFACWLTSPLGGFSDDDLLALAPGRRGRLWEALRARAPEHPHWQAAWETFAALLARVDFASPHALLAEALGPMGGRARLYRRLGPEAAEPVDEMLNAALAYAQTHPPSLQGFLHWLRQSAAEVKREAEGAGNAVRVMTVHGAKGLQAPLVILPDTTALPQDPSGLLWLPDPDTGAAVPVWCPRAALRCAAVDAARAAIKTAQIEEYHRLLYVALTRAEDRLLVCGWETGRGVPDGSWYKLVERGFARLGPERAAFAAITDPWPGEHAVLEAAQTAPPERPRVAADQAEPLPLPGWAGAAPGWVPAPPPPEPFRPLPLAPSRPENADLAPVPQAASPLALRDAAGARFRRGQLVHSLLQHLPVRPAGERAAAARAFLGQPGNGLSEPDADALAGEVMAVIGHPDLAPLFGPFSRAEVPLTGLVGQAVVAGLVDRLAVLPDRILAVDFKTNRNPPADVAETPVLYLRQMAAYRAVLQGVFPGRAVICALVWTQVARVSILPESLLDSHAPGAHVPRA